MKAMTEAAVENELCAGCGADVRPEALFCYNCGDSLDPEAQTDGADAKISDAWFRGDIAGEEVSGPDVDAVDVEIAKPNDKLDPEESIEKAEVIVPAKKTKPRRKPKMRSAATIQKNRAKSLPSKKVEVIWEEKESSPNIWFIVSSIVIVSIVAVLFYLARLLQ